MGVRARLMPMLKAIRSMLSRFSEPVFDGKLVGYSAFMKAQKGRKKHEY
jgi:hypothetical protein